MTQGVNNLSLALAMRLRDMARMLDRLDRLESGTGEWLAAKIFRPVNTTTNWGMERIR